MLSLKTVLAGAYSWGSSHLPDLSAQELDTQTLYLLAYFNDSVVGL